MKKLSFKPKKNSACITLLPVFKTYELLSTWYSGRSYFLLFLCVMLLVARGDE